MRKIILALLICLAPLPAFAQYVKPDSAPVTSVPDYNIQIGVWAVDAIPGTFVGIFEYNPHDGKWYGWAGNGTIPSITFDVDVGSMGGPDLYVRTWVVPELNKVLAKRYPPISAGPQPPPSGSAAILQVNYLLSTGYAFKVTNGLETLGPK